VTVCYLKQVQLFASLLNRGAFNIVHIIATGSAPLVGRVQFQAHLDASLSSRTTAAATAAATATTAAAAAATTATTSAAAAAAAAAVAATNSLTPDSKFQSCSKTFQRGVTRRLKQNLSPKPM
jgi:hypothetical protein